MKVLWIQLKKPKIRRFEVQAQMTSDELWIASFSQMD